MNTIFKRFLTLSIFFLLITNVFAINEKTLIGDDINVEVYSFIQDTLLRAKTWDKKSIAALYQDQIANKNNPEYKPLSAEIYEGEISALLRILCKVHPDCEEITLYQKNGVGIAASGLKHEIDFTPVRKIDIVLGILTAENMHNLSKTTRYQDKRHHGFYVEQVKAIYQSRPGVAYLSTTPKKPEDQLIGYVSYLLSSSSHK